MWFLQGLGHDRGLRHVKISALKLTGVLRPCALDNGQGFLEAFAAFFPRHMEPLKVDGNHATPDPKL
jgi:hypothetical protein